MKTEKYVNIDKPVAIKDGRGNIVRFNGISQYDASSLFSDTVDLPTPGYIAVQAAGTLELMLVGDDSALPWTFDQSGIYPLLVKRIMSTGSDAITTYIVN